MQISDKKKSNQNINSLNIFGINVGSSTIKLVNLCTDSNEKTSKLVNSEVITHYGSPIKVIEYIKNNNDGYFGVSGLMGSIPEISTIEYSLKELKINCDAILSLGAEVFLIYLVNSSQKIFNVFSENKCAAGSGEFLTQQFNRLGLTLTEGINLGFKGKEISLASRCSVHCKSDITHKLNRNEASKADISYSVIKVMAKKIVNLISSVPQELSNILLIGGCVKNNLLIKIIKELLPDKNIFIVPESGYFEAFGTALLVSKNPQFKFPQLNISKSFTELPPLRQFSKFVIEKSFVKNESHNSGPYILGIDGGSTTTKLVIMSCSTNEIVASQYLRTNGDPITATRNCLRNIINISKDYQICAIGTTGSARKIIATFTGSSCTLNEISAHARGAVEFDPDVDTVFEIGGQDSKYIYLNQGVPISYAMNEACSAGTGSFIEEAAKGDLNLDFSEIEEIALSAKNPINFKDNCAAFINTDIRTALQEGYTKSNIVAGVIHSIANNYMIKVKGKNQIGKKIFFQGGVAKNKAVSHALAYRTQSKIIIPPNPELMGAYGIALLVSDKIKEKKLQYIDLKLNELINRDFRKVGTFVCKACSNHCIITRLEVADKIYPFGGSCSRWENTWLKQNIAENTNNFVQERNDVVLALPTNENMNNIPCKTIGIPRALLTHSLFPLFSNFFAELGFKVILSDKKNTCKETFDTSFCYPIEIAQIAIENLIDKDIKTIFLPHVQFMPISGSTSTDECGFDNICIKKEEITGDSHLCYFTQSLPYMTKLKYSRRKNKQIIFLTPKIDFTNGYNNDFAMINLYTEINVTKDKAISAYQRAIVKQMTVEKKLLEIGKNAFKNVINNKKSLGIILVGRSYNAFPPETSMNIAKKLTSMGITVIPFDCLPRVTEEKEDWYFSNLIMNAVKISLMNPNIFILYISNFSCGPDAFTQTFLRQEMQNKPYLLLEIDSHTADAGIFTRVEAFIEIIKNYSKTKNILKTEKKFQPSKMIIRENEYYILNSKNEEISIFDKRVKIYFPAISKYHTQAIAMILRWKGFNALEATVNIEVLNLGKKFVTGKECIPLPITIGQMMDAYQQKSDDEIVGYYMIEGGAPCIAVAYKKFFENTIIENKLNDLFLFDPSSENNNYGKGSSFYLDIIYAMLLADLINEIKSSIMVVSDKKGLTDFENHWEDLINNSNTKRRFTKNLTIFVAKLREIKLLKNINSCPKVVVTGDFFVRFDPFSKQNIDELYAKEGIILKAIELTEFALYSLYETIRLITSKMDSKKPITKTNIIKAIKNIRSAENQEFLTMLIGIKYIERKERQLRKKLSKTGLLFSENSHIEQILELGQNFIDQDIFGEAILTIGKILEAKVDNRNYDGGIIIGPFNCMPYRISENILKSLSGKMNFSLLFFETDCSPMPTALYRQIDVHIKQIKRNYRLKKK